jgi:hypothetical protein
MNQEGQVVFRHLQRAWNEIQSEIAKLRQSSSIKPLDALSIFKPETGADGEIKIKVDPIIFKGLT